MRLHLSLGHLRLDLTICEDDLEPGDVHALTAETTIADPDVPEFGFWPDEDRS